MLPRHRMRKKNTCLGPPLLTRINVNPSMDKSSHAHCSVGWNYLSIPKRKRLHRWSLWMDNQFHPGIMMDMMDVIIHRC